MILAIFKILTENTLLKAQISTNLATPIHMILAIFTILLIANTQKGRQLFGHFTLTHTFSHQIVSVAHTHIQKCGWW